MMIRSCRQEDLDAVAFLFSDVYSEPPYKELWSQHDATLYLKRFLSFDPDHCFLALEGDEVVGAVFGFSYPWMDRTVYSIQELFVRKSYRRQGVGRTLLVRLDDVLGRQTGFGFIVNRAASAVEFYNKLGFYQHPEYAFFCGDLNPDVVKEEQLNRNI